MLFRPIRTLILILVAFVAGVLFERAHQRSLCEEAGDIWLKAGVCGES